VAVIVSQMTTARVRFGDLTGDILVEGDRFEREVTWADDDTGDAINFTGWTPTSEVRDVDGLLLATFTITPSPGDGTGKWLFVLDPIPSTMVGINAYDMEITDGSSIKTLQTGKIQITAQETV